MAKIVANVSMMMRRLMFIAESLKYVDQGYPE